MAKLTRKDQKVFAENADDNQISVFGSLAAGTKQYTRDPDEIQNTQYSEGWSSAVIRESSPTKQDRNSLDYLFSRQLAYLYQTGIPAYSATDTYFKGSIVSSYDTEEDALKLYYSIVDDNTGNSLEDGDKWVEWKSGGGASLPILTYQFTDHELNDVSWLKSNFSWCSGSVYVAAYKHLQNDVGFRYASSTLTVSHSDFDAGVYVRISTLDKTINTTDYYAWGISGTTEDTKCVYTLTTTLADGVKTYFYKNSAMQQLTSCIVEAQTETISGTTITYFRAQDGHKIVLDDQATNVASIYSATGVAWYYIFDDTNTRFKLPRSNWEFKGTSNDDAGDYVGESLPNIKGSARFDNGIIGTFIASDATGAFKQGGVWTNSGARGATGNNGPLYYSEFDASSSNSTYQDSAPVQPRATKAYLYFYVGNFEQSAIEQTAGINAEDFQQKADLDLGNVNHDGATQIAHLAMPGTTFESPTLGASGDSYTAPADGYYCISRQSTAANQYVTVSVLDPVTNTTLYGEARTSPITNDIIRLTIPIFKGGKIVIYYTAATAGYFHFIYAKGSEPQA